MSDCRPREVCGLCGSPGTLTTLMTLPKTPLANEYVDPSEADEVQEEFPLVLGMCRGCRHVQLMYVVAPKRLFANYVYATGTSKTTIDHLRGQANQICYLLRGKEKPFVVEVGSNDGSLLKILKSLGVERLMGVDPATKMVEAARGEGLTTVEGFFSSTLAEELKRSHGPADLVVANNVMAHTDDVLDMILGVKEMLAPGGFFMFEVSHLLDMAVEGEDAVPPFDTIYHEHLSYHSLRPLAAVLDGAQMPIIGAYRQPSQVGRGSLRVIACSGPGRSVNSSTARKILFAEEAAGLHTTDFYKTLNRKIDRAGERMRGWIDVLQRGGASIVGYGAAAKMTTLTYAFGLEGAVDYVVDDSKWKQGLLAPGTHVPIKDPEVLKEQRPNTCLVFAWNFADDIVSRYEGSEINFLIPLPVMRDQMSLGAPPAEAKPVKLPSK